MSIVKLNTPALPAPTGSSTGGSSAILWILVLAAAGWAGYTFWWKPMKEAEEKKQLK